ncbi:MAG: hypothetical protein ABL984_17070 [Pyrinomonadaceae bacterium]
MDKQARYDLDRPDDEEMRQLAEDHRRRMRFKAHYKKWKWWYDVKESIGERFMVLWTVGVVYGTLRFMFAIILVFAVLFNGYHLLHNPKNYRELPTQEEIMKLPDNEKPPPLPQKNKPINQ